LDRLHGGAPTAQPISPLLGVAIDSSVQVIRIGEQVARVSAADRFIGSSGHALSEKQKARSRRASGKKKTGTRPVLGGSAQRAVVVVFVDARVVVHGLHLAGAVAGLHAAHQRWPGPGVFRAKVRMGWLLLQADRGPLGLRYRGQQLILVIAWRCRPR